MKGNGKKGKPAKKTRKSKPDFFNRSLFKGLGVGLYRTTPEGRILDANPAMISILGYPDKETLLAINVNDTYVDAEDRLRWKHMMESRRIVRNFEAPLRRYDGRIVWVKFSARTIHDEESTGPYYEGSMEDITEKRKAEEELKISEMKFRSVAETASDAIVSMDTAGNIVFWNPGASRMFGYAEEEIQGRPFVTLFNKRSGDMLRRELEKTISQYNDSISKHAIEVLGLTRDANEFPVEVSLAAWSVRKQKFSTAIIRDISERKRAEQELKLSLEKVQSTMKNTILVMSKMLEARDPYTAGHQQRVAQLASAVAGEMGLPEKKVEEISFAGIVHDIGKIYVPAEILSKPTRLSSAEFEIVKTHPNVAYEILKPVEFPWAINMIVLQHHERLDGSGYPSGLSGEDINLGARITAVADVVEAMNSHRPYRAALGIEKALGEISGKRGTLFDPDAVDACLELFAKKDFQFR